VYREPGAELPERPPISAPERPLGAAADQPALGLKGLALVVPTALALAVGAGAPEHSAAVLGPLVTYALPLIAMVAFWWEDWPGTRLPPRWSGWADTALIAVGALASREVGEAVAGHSVAFPAAAFIAMLQLTLVGEGCPLRRLPRITAGWLALASAWAAALVARAAFAGSGDHFTTVLIVIGAWQTLFYVALRGWPFSAIARRGRRLACAHAGVLAAALLSYLALRGFGDQRLGAYAACFVAGAIVFGMLLEGWLGPAMTLIAAAAGTVLLAVPLRAIAADGWVTHVGLNAVAVAVLLHVAIGRRWPFGA
jgi:hypothetical protein